MKRKLFFLAALLLATVMNLQAADVPAGTGDFSVTFTGECQPDADNDSVFIIGNFEDAQWTVSSDYHLDPDNDVPGKWKVEFFSYPANFEFQFVVKYEYNDEGRLHIVPKQKIVFDGSTKDFQFVGPCRGPEPPAGPDTLDYLYFVGLNGNDTVRLNKYEVNTYVGKLTATFEYSKDRINWTAYDTWATTSIGTGTYQGNPIALNQGDTVFFRAKGENGKNATMSNNTSAYFRFAFGEGDSIAAGGNVMSLYDASREQKTMTAYGFYRLFERTPLLVSAPKLPATQLAAYCYKDMFSNCDALTSAPELPATTLERECYASMFKNCYALTSAPELKATQLAAYCYKEMFSGCKALTSAPELPASEMTEQCYQNMFSGCKALTQIPELKITTLATSCYEAMFRNCSSLQVDTLSGVCDGVELQIPTPASEPKYWNRNMFQGCKGTITKPQLGGHYCIKEYKEEPAEPDMHDYLHFVGLNGNDTVRLNKYEVGTYVGRLTATFEYSKDRKTWTAYDTWATSAEPASTYQGNPIALNQGDTVFFRAKGENGKNATMSNSSPAYFNFAFGADDSIAAGGNTMSLYDATCEQDTMTEYGFYKLFINAKQLVTAPKLPATALADRCYNSMFCSCTSLTTAQALSTTTLATNCYGSMFKDCTSLTTAPALPATTLLDACYGGMFRGCTALTQAPELKATTLAQECYGNMFRGCTALIQAPELKATTLAEKCYNAMFYGCTSLQVDTCTGSCDGVMFEPTTIGDEPANWNLNMFKDCKGTVTQPQLGGHYCIKEYKEEPDTLDYLHFVGLNGNDTVRLNKFATSDVNLSSLTATFEYSKDRKTWTAYDTWGTYGDPVAKTALGAAIALNQGDTVFFRAKGVDGKNATLSYASSTYFKFAFGADDQIAAGGNIMSLYDATCEQDTMTEKGFTYLFTSAKQLVSASELKLPATKLAISCYCYMFNKCTSLTQAPELPATMLTVSCYNSMFSGCTALTQAPELKATTLAKSCYTSMFFGCISLLVDTCADGNCDGAKLEVPTVSGTAPDTWNLDMFKGCKGDAKYTDQWGIKLGGHYCIKEYDLCSKKKDATAPAVSKLTAKPIVIAGLPIDVEASTLEVAAFFAESAADTIKRVDTFWFEVKYPGDEYKPITNEDTVPLSIGQQDIKIHVAFSSTECNDTTINGLAANFKAQFYEHVKKGQFATGDEDGFVMNEDIEATVSPAGTVTDGQLSFTGTMVISGKGSLIRGLKVVYEDAYVQCEGKDIPKDGSLFILSEPTTSCVLGIAKDAPQRRNGRTAGNPSPKITSLEVLYEVLPPDTLDYLHFVGLTGNDTVRLDKYSELPKNLSLLTATFEYSKDRKTWTPYDTWASDANPAYTYQGNPIALAKGDTVWFRAKGVNNDGKNATISTSQVCCYRFAFGAGDSIAAGGNTMSLYDATCKQDTMTNLGFVLLFKGAKQLVSAPKLPATTLAIDCYSSMFAHCAALTTAPILPATELIKGCYKTMFMNCTSLQVDTCTGSCDGVKFEPTHSGEEPMLWNQGMFSGCKGDYIKVKLGGHYCIKEYVPVLITAEFDMQGHGEQVEPQTILSGEKFEKPNDPTATGVDFDGWFWDAAGDSAFDFNKAVKYNADTTITIYAKWVRRDYLYLVGLNGNDTVQLNRYATTSGILGKLTATFEYSKDRKTWDEYTWDPFVSYGSRGNIITLNQGDTVFFRAKGVNGKNATLSAEDPYLYFSFGADDSIAAGGNTMSLYDAECKQDTMTKRGFNNLFRGAKQLISAPKLPATQLNDYCYSGMFMQCSSLKEAPELSAMVLDTSCYSSMFFGCKALTKAPELPATNLAYYCYDKMFYGCTSLTQAPELKATILAKSCYYSMFENCSALQVDTLLGSCSGAELVVPDTAAAPQDWNKNMFKGCHEYATTQLGGHYCISEWQGPRALKFQSLDSTRTYDATPLVADSILIEGERFDRSLVTFNVTGSQTEVGESENTFTYTWKNEKKAQDYTVDTVFGKLKVDYISETPVNVTIASLSKTYDGLPLEASYSATNLIGNDSIVIRLDTATLTDAGKIGVRALDYTILRGDTNVTNGYLVTPILQGSLEVTKRPVSLTSGTTFKTYDGTPLTDNTVNVGADEWAPGEGATYNVTGSQTLVGASKNAFTYTFNEGTKATNYEIDTVYGDLTVNYISTTPITISIGNPTKTYDAAYLKAATNVTGLPNGYNIRLDLDNDSIIDVDKKVVHLDSFKIYNANKQELTLGFITPDSVADGSIEITLRPVTLTSATDSKPFDNTALVNKNVTVSGDQWAPGEGATYNVTGSQMQVGQSPNTFSYTLNSNTKATNYQIDTIFGTLAVYCIYHPTIIGMYDKWNIVLNVAAVRDSMDHYQVEDVDVEYTEVTWYKVKGDMDEIDLLTGAVVDDEKATPENGLYHTEAKLMDGSYYAVVNVPEAKNVMGISYFQSNAVFMDAKSAPAYLQIGQDEETPITKRIINGQLVIIKEGKHYNALGCEL